MIRGRVKDATNRRSRFAFHQSAINSRPRPLPAPMAELKTFLFTDICGSVRLKNEMIGRSVSERDLAFINSILTPHRQRIEERLAEFGGRVVSTAGDGHFLVFDHTVPAAQWAVAVQESHRDDPINTPGGAPVEVRISVHSGVPQTDPGDPNNFIGKSVDYASRLNDYATGGQILISRSVMAILDDVGLEGLRLHLHGRRHLKGIGNVEVHELLYEPRGPRPMRNQPKSNNTERQWTVVPTMGFDDDGPGGRTTVATGPPLTHVGNYQLEDLLGSGGMGDVYKARHTQFGRVRAVKVIKPQFVSSGHTEVIRRFYNEIKAVGRLEHRNIVVAIDSSAPTDNVHYLVMEYIEGVSLDELVAQHGPLPIAAACEVIRQAARGLQYIHKNDMVHRDIKPSNLMITLQDGEQAQSDSTLTQSPDGQRPVVKILDLGLALLADEGHDRLTRFEQKAMGTGMYMPPEQWRTTSVDIRADIYSLGCTLYHLLAGNPPFYDSDLRPEKAHEKSAVPAIRSSIQPLPKKLWEVLRKMLEKRPEDRYATPAEVAAALAPFAEGHDLGGLVRGFHAGETPTVAARETLLDGASQVDTWRSRPWFSGVDLKPSRKWLLGTALPLVLLAIFSAAAIWILREGRQEDLRKQAEKQAQELRAAADRQREAVLKAESYARDSLSSAAKHAARTTLPAELARRFQALEEAAREQPLIDALGKVNVKVPAGTAPLTALDPESLKTLDDWIARLAHRHGNQIVVDSWFVNNQFGVQVARSPYDTSVGQSYRHRDYFHGIARDVDPTDAAALAELPPIQRSNLSLVYRSSTTKLLKVAFSVPIFDQPPPATETPPVSEIADSPAPTDVPQSEPGQAVAEPPKVIGVLAMSVNVHEFKVLDEDYAAGSEVVLVDLRSDWVEDKEQRGLILHHPRLEKGQLARIDGKLLEEIDGANPLTEPEFDGRDHFLTPYTDPMAENVDQKYWGAFEPVLYEVGDVSPDSGPTDRVGWIVLVQKPVIE
jgi:serine/threonine protein kinase/class 3 adenylate cyclase